MEAILKMTVVATAGSLLAACDAPETPRPDPYVGRSVSDLAVRFGPPGRTIPVGVLTTVAGVPLFIWIVVTMRRQVTA